MKLKVNPTRMELLKQKKRIAFAKRGHKLLKDKEEQLLIEFRSLINEVKKQRKETEKNLLKFYSSVLKLKGINDKKVWTNMLNQNMFKSKFYKSSDRIYNIKVDKIAFDTEPENKAINFMRTPEYQQNVDNCSDILQQLLNLAFLENKLISFAGEIERTRRRVNALEYVLIPNLEETIKFIAFKLEENERASLVILKHIQLTKKTA